jgi:CTP synthase
MTARVLGVIPARLGSFRLPRKPLHSVAGRPLIEWVWRRAVDTGAFDAVVVATDAPEVADAARAFGAEVEMTREDHPSKYIFVTGGVVSSLGKGIAAASLGRLLKERGLRVTIQKFDPYLNVDPGHDVARSSTARCSSPTTAPRPTSTSGTTSASSTAPLAGEQRHHRAHLPERHHQGAPRRVPRLDGAGDPAHHRRDQGGHPPARADENDVVIVEIGGTVGDIESLPFLEAIRQFRHEVGRENAIFVHLTLVPYIAAAGELKTKPTQHSVRELMEIGIQPDILICRTERPLSDEIKRKIALFCNVDVRRVIEAPDVLARSTRSRSCVPRAGLDEQGVPASSARAAERPTSREWREMVERIVAPRGACDRRRRQVHGARRQLQERAGGAHPRRHRQRRRVDIDWISSEDCRPTRARATILRRLPRAARPRRLRRARGGGNGRGHPATRARTGSRSSASASACRRRSSSSRATSAGSTTATQRVRAGVRQPGDLLMESQQHVTDMGGTMRLGAYPCRLARGSRAAEIYGVAEVSERHRHRYEVNNAYREVRRARAALSGLSPDGSAGRDDRAADHPWFVGCQFHPELQSRPTRRTRCSPASSPRRRCCGGGQKRGGGRREPWPQPRRPPSARRW